MLVDECRAGSTGGLALLPEGYPTPTGAGGLGSLAYRSLGPFGLLDERGPFGQYPRPLEYAMFLVGSLWLRHLLERAGRLFPG
jgi:hypothetical protein